MVNLDTLVERLDIPMLFVGVKDPDPVGSKASLAELFFDKLQSWYS